MANVNVAVGVRRAVMQYKRRFAGFGLANLLIQAVFFPAFQHLRFALRQVPSHWEGGFRQIQCGFVITHSYCSIRPRYRELSRVQTCTRSSLFVKICFALATSRAICSRSASRLLKRCSSLILATGTTVICCP